MEEFGSGRSKKYGGRGVKRGRRREWEDMGGVKREEVGRKREE